LGSLVNIFASETQCVPYLISSHQAGEASSGPGENQGEVNSTSVMVITAPEAVYLSKIVFFRFLAIRYLHRYYSLCTLFPSIFSHFAYIYPFNFNFSLILSLFFKISLLFFSPPFTSFPLKWHWVGAISPRPLEGNW
jgi:hypothetical protein